MDVAAGGDVVVVFRKLGVIDDEAKFVLFLPPGERIGDALDAFGRDEVLGVAFFEDLTGVDEEDFALPGFGLGPVEEEDDARGGGIVEEVFGQVEDAFYEVVVDEPLADGFFFVDAGIARAAGGVQGFFCGRARQVKPVLEKMDSQHAFDAYRGTPRSLWMGDKRA